MNLFGVDVYEGDIEQTVARCVELIESGRFSQQTSLNAGKVVLMEEDIAVLDAVRSSDIVSADGQSIVVAARVMGGRVAGRVAGIDLMERLLQESERRGFPVYFLGARSVVLQRFVATCNRRYPRLKVAGCHDGYYKDAHEVAQEIGHSGARLLFVAMPSPQKELFVAKQEGELGCLFCMGVGGSFDVWAGETSRAPRWMQQAGLEWFYRFIQEPRRMWRRYLIGNIRFLRILARRRILKWRQHG